MQVSAALSLSPSFDSCSNSKLAEIADRVVQEFRSSENEMNSEFFVDNNEDDDGDFGCFDDIGESLNEKADDKDENDDDDDDEEEDDDEFEFAFATRDFEFSPISADEIFCNGQIRPIFPVFNRDLLSNNVEFRNRNDSEVVSIPPPASNRLPLRKLFIEEREANNSSCSSSEADDLERVPPGTYCVWRPKPAEEASGHCKKSKSTGSSKRWKFRDLLHRSNSDGKDTFVFLTPSKKREDKGEKTNVKNLHGGDKKKSKSKSNLPYRQDLIGLFSNMNGLSRSLQPL